MSDYGSPPVPPPPPSPYGVPAVQGNPPPNYLVWAILCTVLCCLPLGVASIVFSAQVNNRWGVGDVAGAQHASVRARTFAIWSVITGVIFYSLVAFFIFYVVGVLGIGAATIDNSGPGN
jgi:heme/copper-type cytochrome/quinol oxidase subunit 2